MSITTPASWVDDRSLYPIHEEDDVPEIPRHELEVRNLLDVLAYRFPDRFVTGNACIYWIPGDFQLYYAPDAFVAAGPPAEPDPRVYHIWQDPPIAFVAEVKSRSITEAQREHNFRICEQVLCIPELLEFDPDELLLRMWRLAAQGYETVEPGTNGRLRSRELELEFGLDEEGRLRVCTPDGDVLRFYKEAERDRELAEARATEESRQREAAEARAAEEARQRAVAEARAAEEARQRAVAEARAAEEASQRETAETRAIEEARQREALEREVEALRAALARQVDRSEDDGAPE
jgi:Uma2 family endonuclease